MQNDHPLYRLAADLMKEDAGGLVFPAFSVKMPIPEPLEVEGYELGLTDGTGRDLYKDIVYFAKRKSGEVIEVDSYCLFGNSFKDALVTGRLSEGSLFFMEAIKKIASKREENLLSNEMQLNKKIQFLLRAFEVDDVFNTYDVMLGLKLQKKFANKIRDFLNNHLHGDETKFDLSLAVRTAIGI